MSNDQREHAEATETTTGPFDRISRRRLVATGAATWASLALAGCGDGGNAGDGGNVGGDGGGETTTSAVTATTTTTTTNTAPDTTNADETPTTTATTTTETTTETTVPTTTTTTEESSGGTTTTQCEEGRRFVGGFPIGLLVGLYDTDTATPLGPGDADAVTVRFDDPAIPDLELVWDGRHADFDADSWGGRIDTSGLATGTYHYDVVVSTGGDRRLVRTDQFVLV